MLREFLWVPALAAIVLVAIAHQRRWNRLRAELHRLEEYADALLQHGQGTILNIQGLVSELSAADPVRLRIERALARADRDLSDLREIMEPHCSKQQHELMQ